MPNTRTSDEAAATSPLVGTELVRIVQAGANAKATASQIAATLQFTQTATGAVVRSIQSKLAELITVADFGALLDGVHDDSAAILAMYAAVGYAVIPRGNARIGTNSTFIGLLVFLPGAYLSIDGGVTLNMEGMVESPLQYIFRGTGVVLFGGSTSTNTYSEARIAAAEWFGVDAGSVSDQMPYLQAAINSMTNLREGVVTLPIGTLTAQTTLSLNRCVALIGKGSRRTVFSMTPNGVTGIITAGVGVRIEGVQFEAPAGTYKSGAPCINILHADCEVIDISVGSTTQGILVSPAGSFCRIDRTISLVQPTTLVAGSSVIEVQASNCTITNTRAHTGGTTQYLEAIVRISTSGSGITGNTIGNTDTNVVGAIAAQVAAVNDNIALTTIDGVVHNGTNGTGFNVSNTGTAAVQGLNVDNVQVAANASLGAGLSNTSTGSITRAIIRGLVSAGGAATAVSLTNTGGGTMSVKVNASDISGATTPLSVTGTITDLRIDTLSQPTRRTAAQTFSQTIANSGVFTLATGTSIFGSQVIVSVNNVEYGMYLMRAASGPAVISVITPTTNMASTTGALTGTTGTAGKFTVSADASGNFYFENRLGASALAQITFMTGIQTTAL